MNIPENMKSELIVQFKSEKALKFAFENFELYKFSELNSTQISKLYSISLPKIFNEPNAKKHLQKVFEMIKNNFYNENTNSYLNLFFYPTINTLEIEKRRDAILKISSLKSKLDSNESSFKNILCRLKEFDFKIVLQTTVYTLEKETQNYFYENYSFNMIQINRKDLEEMQNSNENDFIIISEEHLHIENDQYNLKSFEKVIEGYLIKKNKIQISNLISLFQITSENLDELMFSIEKITSKRIELRSNLDEFQKFLEKDTTQPLKELLSKVNALNIEVEKINLELKNKISTKKVSLDGEELLELLNSGNMQAIANKLKDETSEFIKFKEKEIIDNLKSQKISANYIFESHNYPLKIDEEIKLELIQKIERKLSSFEYENYIELSKFNFRNIKVMLNAAFYFDLFYAISKFSFEENLKFANIAKEYSLIDTRNIYIKNAMPISYGLGINEILGERLNNEKISVLTGANSGGKTTLLEMFLQSQILTCMGLGISGSESSKLCLVDEVIYLKKFTGTQGSGAFEQTIRNLIEILDSKSSKLILIDEFEAITEPGAAAKILIGFLEELSKQQNFCIAVSHLGKDIKEFVENNKITSIRIDGISATGLDESGNLITNHQPKFNCLGKSTPELILKKVISDENFWKGKDPKTKELLENILN